VAVGGQWEAQSENAEKSARTRPAVAHRTPPGLLWGASCWRVKRGFPDKIYQGFGQHQSTRLSEGTLALHAGWTLLTWRARALSEGSGLGTEGDRALEPSLVWSTWRRLNHGLVGLRVLTSDAKDRGIERAQFVLRPVHMAV
jgi:hypothetical protein